MSASSIAEPKCSTSERPLITISPSPGSSRTRATAVLRRPVPVLKAWVVMRGPPSGERLRPLGLMGMIRAGVDLELAQLLGAEPRVREHALDRPADNFLGPALEQLAERLLLEALGMAAVADVGLGLELGRADRDLARVQHDHVVAAVEVRRPGRLVLALEDASDTRGEAAERLARRIHDEPVPLDLALSRCVRLVVHQSSCPVSGCVPFRSLRRPSTTRRRQSPRAGAAAPRSAGRPALSSPGTAEGSSWPFPTASRTATIRRTMPRRKASARTSIVTSDPSRRTRSRCTVRTGCGSAPPTALKSWRPSKAVAARAIAAMSRSCRTQSAVRSRSGLREPFQMEYRYSRYLAA